MDTINYYGYIMNFGKFKGHTVSYVMNRNASYLLWAHDNIEWFKLSPSLLEAAKRKKAGQDIAFAADMAWGDGGDPYNPEDDSDPFGDLTMSELGDPRD